MGTNLVFHLKFNNWTKNKSILNLQMALRVIFCLHTNVKSKIKITNLSELIVER